MASIVFDFDSTVVSKETLDYAIAKALAAHPERDRIICEIEAITTLGMEGAIDFRESVRRRVSVISLSQSLLQDTGRDMLEHVTSGFPTLFAWLRAEGHDIHIASGGYIECIGPVAEHLGVDAVHTHTNRFIFSSEGDIVGFDEDALLWTDQGKTPVLHAIRALRPGEKIVIVGDGANDLRAYESGAADDFVGFGEHAIRTTVQSRAPHFVTSATDLLEHFKNTLQ